MAVLVGVLISAWLLQPRQGGARSETYDQANARGLSAFEAGRLDESIEAFKKCVELQPTQSDSAFNLFRVYSSKGEIETALDWLGKCIDGVGLSPGMLARLSFDAGFDPMRAEPRFQLLYCTPCKAILTRSSMSRGARMERAFSLPLAMEPCANGMPRRASSCLFWEGASSRGREEVGHVRSARTVLAPHRAGDAEHCPGDLRSSAPAWDRCAPDWTPLDEGIEAFRHCLALRTRKAVAGSINND